MTIAALIEAGLLEYPVHNEKLRDDWLNKRSHDRFVMLKAAEETK